MEWTIRHLEDRGVLEVTTSGPMKLAGLKARVEAGVRESVRLRTTRVYEDRSVDTGNDRRVYFDRDEALAWLDAPAPG